MDLQLRTRYRDLLQEPGDPELAEALRSSLGRANPEDAAQILDDLIGAYFASASWENTDTPERRHLRFCGPGLLAPLPPAAAEVRWGQRGALLGVTHALALIEHLNGDLVGHDLRTGALAWRVSSLLGQGDPLDADQGRRERLGWAVAPWGAVEVVAEFDAPLTYRRRGRYHAELGRVTERSPVDRMEAGIWLRLQVARPAGGWGLGAPTLIQEEASGGEGLCQGELELTGWDDALYELELDPSEARFAIRTLEQDRGEGHAFSVCDEPSPRVDPLPWRYFPELHPEVPQGALEEVLLQRASRGDTAWTLNEASGKLSCSGGGEWGTGAIASPPGVVAEGTSVEPGAGLDLIPFQGCAWLLGPGPAARVFRPGLEPRSLDLSEVFDGRAVGGAEGVRGFGLEGGLLLQGGSESVTYLA